MSATPPNPAAAKTPPVGGPNGPLLKRRRPRPVDPLVRPKKRPIARPQADQRVAGRPPGVPTNGADRQQQPQPTRPQAQVAAPAKLSLPRADDITVNGFSGPLLSETYADYPLVTTKRALREGLRHNIAKLISKKSVDPRDESQFTRPVRLQRRDPRAFNNSGNGVAGDKDPNSRKGYGYDFPRGMDDAEREQLEAKKESRAKEREENLAQIAPSAAAGPRRANPQRPRTQQVFKSELTPEEIAKSRVKYEEALPWHLEDFDNKNTWVGKFEAAMSDTYVIFVLESSGKMRMVPIDKWYKFTAKNQFKALTIEEAEKHMAKRIRDPRWFMEKEQARAQEQELQQFARQRKVYTGQQQMKESAEGFEGDDMDFEEDRFADDEEHVGLFDEDEEAKTAEKRIKEDQLKANIFDLRQEKVYDEEATQEKREKEALKNFGKQVRKALQRREKNFDYSSGSDANPYSEDSTDESADEGETADAKKAENPSKREDKPSISTTKGTNTPSEQSKKSIVAARKRASSPNMSDASGTDTLRKKPKNKHLTASRPASRPRSPAPSATSAAGQRKPSTALGTDAAKNTQVSSPNSKKRVRNGGSKGAAGEGDRGAASSGAEMSDSAVSSKKKLKLNPPAARSRTATPITSRAGSPTTQLSAAGRAVVGSRASSPEGDKANQVPTAFPTPTEIHAAIPASGIGSNDLLRLFRSRLGNSRENHRRFIAIVKEVSIFGKEDKLLRPGVIKES